MRASQTKHFFVKFTCASLEWFATEGAFPDDDSSAAALDAYHTWLAAKYRGKRELYQ